MVSSPTLARRLAAIAAAVLLAGPAAAVTGGSPSATFLSVAIGVQVTPDWVITAEHVVLNPGDIYNNGYGPRVVAARYDAPGALAGFPANDLALLRLVPLATVAPYLSVSDTLFADGMFAPLNVTIASGNALRRYGFTTLVEAERMIDPDDGGPLKPVTANYLLSYDSAVHVEGGDSGGGLFLGRTLDNLTPLLGISSALLEMPDPNNPNVMLPIGSGFVQIAVYKPWIDATMAADPAEGQMIHWVTVAVPEPSTLLLWGAGLVLLATRRRA